jgi:predicted SprT family Zn-dependent metalloprotease
MSQIEKQIIEETKALLSDHGCEGWAVKVNGRLTRAFGVAKFGRKEIHISRQLAEINSWERTLDTIRHEVAHVIAGPKAGHGPEWKKACALTGAAPRRCFSAQDTVIVEKKGGWVGFCEGCGQKVGTRKQAPREGQVFYHMKKHCSAGGPEEGRKVRWDRA